MRLTILGACGSYPGPDGACAGYLLEAEGQLVLIDCGSGVLARLQRYCRPDDLDAIIASHLHFDHMADLLVLQYGLGTKMLLEGGGEQVPLYLPATPEHVVALLDHQAVFAHSFIEDGQLVQLGALTITFARMEHSAESYAVTVMGDGKKLVYSGDTLPNPRLVEAAQGADLFLCEATALAGAQRSKEVFPHMSAREAAEAAREAGVGRLLLTHRWYEFPPEEYAAEARSVFAASENAEEWGTYRV